MSGYCLITAHLDPQNAHLADPIGVMFFDSPERGWDQLPPVWCRIDADRARELSGQLCWLADYGERLRREGDTEHE